MKPALAVLLGCSPLGACASDPHPEAASWELVTEHQPAAVLSLWANRSDNVWVVGAHQPTGGPIIEHYDGTTWTKFHASGFDNVDLWWVTGFDDGRVFMGGSQGTILTTTDGSSFTQLAAPAGFGNVTVFGIWGASSTDAWAVGGTPGGFVWRYNGGAAWTNDADYPAELASAPCWKVNGLAADDVWLSANSGTVLHWNGGSLDSMPIPDAQLEQDNLLSIGANSWRVITVGGAVSGVLYENDGNGWTSPLGSAVGAELNSVAVNEHDAYVVGAGGLILHSASAGTWKEDAQDFTLQQLHASFIDPDGDVWAVGGNLSGLDEGVLLHKGQPLHGSFQ